MINLYRDMGRQWDHDGYSAAARAALARWAKRHPDLARFTSPAQLVAAAQSHRDPTARRYVDQLVDEAPSDPWALRTVLMTLLPALAHLTREHMDMVGPSRQAFATIQELDQFLVCAATECISAAGPAPAGLRLRRIVDRTEGRLRFHAKAHRRHLARTTSLSDDVANASPVRSQAEELAMVLIEAVQHHVLRNVDAGLVYTTRVIGHSATDVADALQWPLDTLYRRRHRTEAVVLAEGLGRPRPTHLVRSA